MKNSHASRTVAASGTEMTGVIMTSVTGADGLARSNRLVGADQPVVGVHHVEVHDAAPDLVLADGVEGLRDRQVGAVAGGVRPHVLGDGVAEDLADGGLGSRRFPDGSDCSSRQMRSGRWFGLGSGALPVPAARPRVRGSSTS